MAKYVLLLPLMLWCAVSAAIDTFEIPKDPVLAQRYQGLTEELRCLVCQNQNLADSGAGLATDLKLAIVEQLQAGRSDEEIVEYMKARYGDFVSYDPPMDSGTAALWIVPLVILIIGLLLLILLGKRRAANTAKPSATQADAIAKLDALLEKDSERG